jgi:heptosyltransferase-2
LPTRAIPYRIRRRRANSPPRKRRPSPATPVVSNDTGPAHIAAALGTKTLVIFGPTNPLTTRPFPENAEIFYKNVECSPCMLRDCPIDHRCMTRISTEEVLVKAQDLLTADKQR